ncbi:protein MAIN-LIKE 1-like [Vicia villosa]|uniref:protein MAIN-LIKE 1-like n=1 Tax=Vicia villosa TaxID=3911 RepID=UPI00273C0E30|nr:protein MAIN-LIKE 1-like [Vicia villosa]
MGVGMMEGISGTSKVQFSLGDTEAENNRELSKKPQPSDSRSLLSQASQTYDTAEPEDPEAPVDLEALEEADPDAPLESYSRGQFDTSLLYNYAKHAARHVWHVEERDCLKIIKHDRKILEFSLPTDAWFGDVIRYYGLAGLCSSTYVTINHDMQVAFAESLQSETSSFHIPIGKMTITLDEVPCLLHLLIRERLLDHERIKREKGVNLMVTLLGVDPSKESEEANCTRGAHAQFRFLEKLYKEHVKWGSRCRW